MRESYYRSLLSQTANGAVDLMVATIPQMLHAFEEERPPATRPKDRNPDAAVAVPWGRIWHHQICSHIVSHPRTHLAAVAGLLITGVLVLYITALHMGYLGSEEAALISFNPTPPNSAAISAMNSIPLELTNNRSDVKLNASIPIPAGTPQSGDTSPVLYNLNDTQTTESSFRGLPSDADVARQVEVSPPPPRVYSTPTVETTARVYYQNMSETWHTMGDEELLRSASSVGATEGGRPSLAAKIAYLFMTRGPLPFAPLWERYFRGHESMYSIYIHAHPNYVPAIATTSPFFRRFIPSQVVEWGKLSVYVAERRLLGNALLDRANEWFLLLSESCIPVFSFPDAYTYLNHSEQNFIESYVDSSRLGQGRLYRGNFKAMAPEITRENFRKGSQWFQINRDLALEAAAESEYYTKFQKYFCQIHPVCYIDEHFLPTLAAIVRPHAIAYRTLTYYEFRGKSSHPKMFHKEDTNRNLIEWFREGHNCTYNGQSSSKCHLFVRKFDPDALDVLLDLAAPVMGIP